jgi:hypothetical protein
MARIHNPVKGNKKKKPGSDGQLHGGMMESVDQMSDAISKSVGNIGGGRNN